LIAASMMSGVMLSPVRFFRPFAVFPIVAGNSAIWKRDGGGLCTYEAALG
jgi:hypothetical protein